MMDNFIDKQSVLAQVVIPFWRRNINSVLAGIPGAKNMPDAAGGRQPISSIVIDPSPSPSPSLSPSLADRSRYSPVILLLFFILFTS